MTKEQLIQIAKVGFPERVQKIIDLDDCEMYSKSGIHRLYGKGTSFRFMLPDESRLVVQIEGDFVQITCGNTAFNHYAAIKEMEKMGLI